ncbi:helix-turn-helix transcriptional regulator [Paenibacillus nasutitermitis]|uniref:HTH araC/xylS-type domain-containing protein n=1 Tax=Paenibacillus nasutitermitis TaxID=1652958 RepID=A0A916Z667_9BACL|nr:AraC family transcriptional regulator [Paenibacillus nasutitermitis]GGD78519.1 hypothetical protein GCM10010911_40730 [Paenibacillus nasutitermitis]
MAISQFNTAVTVIYDPGEWDREGQLWPIRGGSGTFLAGIGPGRRQADYYGLYAVQKGALVTQRSDRRLVLRPGDVYCHFPETPHTCCRLGQEEAELIWLEIDGPGVERFLGRAGFSREEPIVRQAGAMLAEEAFTSMLELMTQASALDDALPYLLQSRLYRLFADLIQFRSRSAGCGGRLPDWLRSGLTHMELHAGAGLTVREAAAAAGVNRSHFSAEFTKRLGITPAAYLTRSRMLEAKRLLADASASVTEVAYAVGYPSLYAFSRAFKKECSLSPSGYRDRLFGDRHGMREIR